MRIFKPWMVERKRFFRYAVGIKVKEEAQMSLNEKIQYMRKKAGMSQEELAEVVGVSRQAVSKWETGEAAPEISKLLLLSRAFGVTADWLISDEGLPERKLEPEAAEGAENAGERSRADADAPQPAPSWVDSVPGVIGKLLRRFGWLVGVYVAIAGGMFLIFGAVTRIMLNRFYVGLPGGLEGITSSVPGASDSMSGLLHLMADAANTIPSPFLTFANAIMIIGAVILFVGIVLAIVLKKKFGGRD